MATAEPSWPAAGTASKVLVTHCGWAPVGSRTEPRGASGTGVVPGLGRAGPEGSLWGQVVMA